MVQKTYSPHHDAWVVFEYEADMFLGLCELLVDGNAEYASLPFRVRNAVVESALLHARQLADILLSRGKYANDIDLHSLLPGFLPSRVAELETLYGDRNTPGSVCEILNTRLAHATTQRGAQHDYSTLLGKLYPILQTAIQEIRDKRH